MLEKNHLTGVLCFFFFVRLVNAQDLSEGDTSYWQKGLRGSLLFNQVSLSNWAAGGQNSISFSSAVDASAQFNKDRISWETNLNLAYGLINQEEEDLQKTDDKIQLLSKFGYKLNPENDKLYWSSMVDFKTQWAPGFDLPNDSVRISEFLAPAYLIINTGLEFKPSSYFSILYAPISAKFTIVNDQNLANQGAFGVDAAVVDENGNIITEGNRLRTEPGTFLNANFKKDIAEHVNLESRLQLFTNYIENFGDIDVNWEVILLFKVNDFLAASITTQLIYDEDVRFEITDENGDVTGTEPRVQFKEVLGIGLNFSL